jgi:hypothetical protein
LSRFCHATVRLLDMTNLFFARKLNRDIELPAR